MFISTKNIIGSLASVVANRFSGKRLVVLIYHRVLKESDEFRVGDATIAEFDTQIRMLSDHFDCMTFGEAAAVFSSGSPSENAVVVTFDDGYRDNHDLALPVLRKYGVPATFFVASGYLAGGIMWNDLVIESIRCSIGQTVDLVDAGIERTYVPSEADAKQLTFRLIHKIKHWDQQEREEFVQNLAEKLSYQPTTRLMMNNEEVRTLHEAGMEIGAHTVSHPILHTLENDESMREIVQSKVDLEAIIGQEVTSFAYPNGRPGVDFSARDVDNVRAAGFRAAATTSNGCSLSGVDGFLVPRQAVWGESPLKLPLQMIRNFRSTLTKD